MPIAILSDTHNRSASLRNALAYLTDIGIDTLFHCGDITTIETARLMAGYTVHYVYGNADVDPEAIREILVSANPASTGGLVFTGEIDGIPIAATHGHLTGKILALAAAGKYSYVFQGHTHFQKDEMLGSTRIINPGALGTFHHGGRTLAILDLQTGRLEYPIFD